MMGWLRWAWQKSSVSVTASIGRRWPPTAKRTSTSKGKMTRKAPTRHKVPASPDPLTGRILPRARAGSSERYPFLMYQSRKIHVGMRFAFCLDIRGYDPDITELHTQSRK